MIKSSKQLDNSDNEWHYVWSLTFSQPASRYYEFRQKLEKNIVSLENISITQSTDQSISSYIKLSGTIKVKNVCYEKLIHLRLTKDNWHTFNDYQATYSSQLSPGTWSTPRRYDTFLFNITIHSNNQHFDINDKIEFAICFTAIHDNQHIEYWDNNDHKNYIIEQRKLRSLCINMNLDSILNSPSSNKLISSNNELLTIDKSLNINQDNSTTEYNITSYTLDCRPNFDGFTSFTHYRAWNHFSGETNYY
ncbi:Protein phosphatase 1 regulatory subunit 3C [Schistosoma japonicum]|nr:Protein phosphatase 1 regulatory subunit 3C [Schistosoma japonicum]KAH8876572.1 Protein phosphatase 1 regulatory subunit 3C [Schistosoma japonicum]